MPKIPPNKKTVISNSHPKSPPIFKPISWDRQIQYLFGVATQAQTSGRDLAIWWVDGGYMVDIGPQCTHIFVDRLVSFHNFSSHPTKSTEANGYRSRTNSGIHHYIQVPHNNGRCLGPQTHTENLHDYTISACKHMWYYHIIVLIFIITIMLLLITYFYLYM